MSIKTLAIASLTLLAALAGLPGAAVGGANAERVESSRLAAIPAQASPPDVVIAWNARAYEVGYGEDHFLTWKAQHAMAMMHLAMHDALNAIHPVYETAGAPSPDPAADPVAAAALAAHDVLRSQYPQAAAALDQELERWLPRTAASPKLARGAALGTASATAILRKRESDGWNATGEYRFDDAPGSYRTTPPHAGFVAAPDYRYARPFALTSSAQFRPAPPPALSSERYAAAFTEVKEQGGASSTHRSPDQTAYAVWWMEFAEGSVNRLARELAEGRKLHLWQAARLFALLDVALYDTYVAVWDSKFEYRHWRPYTAIRLAADDTNPGTAADPNWEPLRPTPPFPEYVSAHAAVCAASFAVLAQFFGESTPFTMATLTAPAGAPTRTFAGFGAAASECADSRVRLGWHFRYSTDEGLTLGRKVASAIATTGLRPLP
jgi:hypothetical protein